jgi:methionyl-tRNA formyltransferase
MMRVIFMGTPEFAVASLEALLEAGIEIVAVVTSPDKPSGRGLKIHETAVKQCAVKHALPVLQPDKLKNPEFISRLTEFKADLFVVVAFRMLPEEVWKIPPLGTINLHASLLPEYRGAAPINWAVINGETHTGTTVFFIEKEIDTGSIISYNEEKIRPDDNAGTLHDRLMLRGASHLTGAVRSIAAADFKTVPQDAAVSGRELKAAPKIFRETCQINWSRSLVQIHNLVRGLSPCPGAWTYMITPKGERLVFKIFETEARRADHNVKPGSIDSDNRTFLRLAAPDGWLEVKNLQLEGKKRMVIPDFLRGVPDINMYRIDVDYFG